MRPTTIQLLSSLLCTIALLLAGCGGPQKAGPKTGGEEKQPAAGGGGGGDPVIAAAPVAPAREVSADLKGDFAAAIKKYEAARKGGNLKGSCGELAAAFGRIYDAHPKVPEAKLNEGVLWEACGDAAKAEQTYNAILSKHPNYGPALNNLGVLYFTRGNVDQAHSYFKKAADVKDSSGYANLAVFQRNQALQNPSLVAEAINNIHRSLAVDSFNIEAYGTLALVLYDHAKTRSQLEMARLICVQATKVDDRYSPVYNLLGLILLRAQRVTPALAEFRKAVGINPNFLEAHMNIGAVTLSFRDYKSAEDSFAKALTLNPDKKTRGEALVGLGVALRGQRKFQEAMKKYEEARKLDPSNVDIVYNMGILLQDYTFDAAVPAKGVATLQQAAGYLQTYASSGKNGEKVKDAQKRIKNINELIPMLKEQEKMTSAAPAPAPKPEKPKKK
jgi:tetratricopeptide (TPR) repeat protein